MPDTGQTFGATVAPVGVLRRPTGQQPVPAAAGAAVWRDEERDESTKVSVVSVARRACLPHVEQVVLTKACVCSSGFWPSERNSTGSGRRTGSGSCGTGTIP